MSLITLKFKFLRPMDRQKFLGNAGYRVPARNRWALGTGQINDADPWLKFKFWHNQRLKNLKKLEDH